MSALPPAARRLVLASASPARLRMLRAAGVEPEVRVSGVDEEAVTAPDPAALVLALARAKAAAVVRPDDDGLVVLGCDSLLDLDGVAYGKPGTVEAAAARWQVLAGRSGVLRTGHAVLSVRAGTVVARAATVASTTVRFGRPTGPELAAYLASGEPLQVAGAFTVDGRGGWFVDGVDGDPGTVIGLSLPTLRDLLGRVGTTVPDLWATAPGRLA